MRIASQGPSLSLVFLCVVAGPMPAEAQVRSETGAIGEKYHAEVAFGWWSPDPGLLIASESLGIPGSDVDLVNDLGIEQKRLTNLRIVLRPATKHKFRFSYVPIKYETDSVQVVREFIFNGQLYRVGIPVSTTAELKTYRFGYEYDFLYMSRGYLGAVIDLKYNDVTVELDTPGRTEFTSQVAPFPTFGLAGRGYPFSNVSITGEFSYIKVPDNLSDDFDGSYFDIDVYGTVNFTSNVGAQLGYRTIDVFYEADFDRGDLDFRGWYFGGVVRF
jgi:hypothetical protein